MRQYLYLWHERLAKRLVASGIEFRDLVPDLRVAGGLVLLRHRFDKAAFDRVSRFDFIPPDRLALLADDNVYGYGDFSWADYGRDVALAELSDQAIAELTFFGHAGRPFGDVEIPGLSNRFLYWAHDDGWYARIFYRRWDDVRSILRRLLPDLLGEEQATRVLDLVRRGENAFWCCGGHAIECEQTENIDALQKKHLTRRST
jgi:hypothetical protein